MGPQIKHHALVFWIWIHQASFIFSKCLVNSLFVSYSWSKWLPVVIGQGFIMNNMFPVAIRKQKEWKRWKFNIGLIYSKKPKIIWSQRMWRIRNILLIFVYNIRCTVWISLLIQLKSMNYSLTWKHSQLNHKKQEILRKLNEVLFMWWIILVKSF